ncbi:hypothetical protein KI387_031684, partial [Taxus chinensis]
GMREGARCGKGEVGRELGSGGLKQARARYLGLVLGRGLNEEGMELNLGMEGSKK